MSYNHKIPRVIEYNGTKIINAYERYTLEIPDPKVKTRELGQVIYKTRRRDLEEKGLSLLK